MSKLQKLIDELQELVIGDKMDTPTVEQMASEMKMEGAPDCAVEEPQINGNEEDDDEPELPIAKQCDVMGCHAPKKYSVRRGNQTCFNLCDKHIDAYVIVSGLKRKPKYI
jgi:hypothetical protein